MPADHDGAGTPQGRAWPWTLDFVALARIGDSPADSSPGGKRLSAGALAGMLAGQLPPGPDLAAWLVPHTPHHQAAPLPEPAPDRPRHLSVDHPVRRTFTAAPHAHPL
jgi:hypothetical protein